MKRQCLSIAIVCATVAASAQTDSKNDIREQDAEFSLDNGGTRPSTSTLSADDGCLKDSTYSYYHNEVSGRKTYQYDTDGNVIEEIVEEWDFDDFRLEERYTWTYDTQGRLSGELLELWGGAWVEFSRLVYTVDGQSNLIEKKEQRWNGSTWDEYWRETNSYDAQSKPVSKIEQFWNGVSWENDIRRIYTYDAQEMLTMEEVQDWDINGGNIWKDYFRYNFTYDVNENMTSMLSQNWFSNVWYDYKLFSYTYNIDDMITGQLEQLWTANAWMNSYQSTFEYDSQGNFTEETGYDWIGSLWTLMTKWNHYYNCGSTAIADRMGSLMVNVWPNPASMELRLSVAPGSIPTTMAIYAVSGQRVAHQPYAPHIDISALPSGIYFLELSSDTAVQSQRFIKM
jgi:hypothetical protein